MIQLLNYTFIIHKNHFDENDEKTTFFESISFYIENLERERESNRLLYCVCEDCQSKAHIHIIREGEREREIFDRSFEIVEI